MGMAMLGIFNIKYYNYNNDNDCRVSQYHNTDIQNLGQQLP